MDLLQSGLANSGIAILTPSQSGGGPGQIYILNRGGARLGTALTTTLLTFVGTMFALLVFGLYSLFVSGIGRTGPLFMGAVTTLTLVSGFMVFSAVWPDFFRIGIAAASRFIWRTRKKRYPLHEWWPPGHPRTGSPRIGWTHFLESWRAWSIPIGRPASGIFGGVSPASLSFVSSASLSLPPVFSWPISVSVFLESKSLTWVKSLKCR